MSNCFLYQKAHHLINKLVVEQLLSWISQYLRYINILTADWSKIGVDQNAQRIFFAYFSTANVNYKSFDELLEALSPHSQIFYISRNLIVIH